MQAMTANVDKAGARRHLRGSRRAPHATTRRCIVTGETLPREALIRFAVGPDDTVVPDLSERLPGRGLWLTCRRDIVAAACDKGAFRRAARRPVTPLVGSDGESLAALVEEQLAQHCLDLLGLARRAGRLVVGFDQVRAALNELPVAGGNKRALALLITARDGAADGRDKLHGLAARVRAQGARLAQMSLFEAAELGAVVGRDRVVHVLVAPDAIGDRIFDAMRRLALYRGEPAPSMFANAVDTD